MNTNTSLVILNVAALAFVGFTCWYFNNPWFLLLLIAVFGWQERKAK